MKQLIIILEFLSITCVTYAQSDSLKYSVDDTHKFRLTQLIVPTVCIGVGIVGTGSDWFQNQSKDIKDELQENIDDKISIDDYTQFAPSAAVYVLNIFGVKGQHDFKDRTIILAMSWLTMSALTTALKSAYGEERPDGSSHNSFPSGHTATAFMGAEFLYQEYKDVSPWIGVAGYAVAAGTGFFRMYNNRHWLNDIIAGAGIGMISTKFSYWIYPKLFKKRDCASHKNRVSIIAMPYYANNQYGCSAAIFF